MMFGNIIGVVLAPPGVLLCNFIHFSVREMDNTNPALIQPPIELREPPSLHVDAVVLNAWKIVSVDGHDAKAAKEDGTVASDPDLLEGFTFEVDFEDLDGATVPFRSHKQKLDQRC